MKDTTLTGQKWKIVANGKRSLNGKRHSVTRAGDIMDAGEDVTAFDVIIALCEQMEDAFASDLEHIDSIQITIFPRNTERTDAGGIR